MASGLVGCPTPLQPTAKSLLRVKPGRSTVKSTRLVQFRC